MLIGLDCFDFESTLETVCRLSGIAPDELQRRLTSIRWDELSIAEPQQRPFSETIVIRVLGTSAIPSISNSTCWFHATRIAKGLTFEDGLLPTSSGLPTIEMNLRSLASDLGLCSADNWGRLPRSGINAQRLARKSATRPTDDGPHGFLIREVTLQNNCYFYAPEAVREICRSLPDKIGTPLLAGFQERTCPALLRFRSNQQCRNLVGAAINYLHGKLTGQLDLNNNPGFDGCGVRVSPQDILGIEYPQLSMNV